GAVIAVVAAVPIMMAEAAGRLADLARDGGAGGAGSAGDDALARFTPMAALAVVFAVRGHLPVVRALAQSYAALPLGPGSGGGAALLARTAIAAARLIAAGAWIAVPWLVTAAVVELGAAAARRAAGLVGAIAPLDGARQVAVIGAVGLGAIATATLIGGQVR